MGVLSKLFGGEVVEPITAVGSVLTSVFGDKGEKMSHEEIMTQLAMSPQLAQVELNKIAAQHRSLLVAGGRPFILWVCGVGLAFEFVINPIVQWITGLPGPVLPTEALMTLVTSLLGLGTLRTVEKMMGRAK